MSKRRTTIREFGERTANMLGFGLRYLNRLEGRERVTLIIYLFLPSASKLAALGAFAVSVRAIVEVAKHRVGVGGTVGWGVALILCMVIATLVTWWQRSTLLSCREIIVRSMRRITGGWLAATRALPESERKEVLEAFAAYEDRSFNQCLGTLLAMLELCAGILLVAAILAGLTILTPLLGFMIIAMGVTMFFFLSGRIISKRPSRMHDLAHSEREKLKELRASIVEEVGEVEPPELVRRFEDNPYDRSQIGSYAEQKRAEARDSALIGMAAMVALLGTFVLISMGYFSLENPVLILVFILALRLAIAQGKNCLEKWSIVLSGRAVLSRLLRMVSTDKDDVRVMGKAFVRLSKS